MISDKRGDLSLTMIIVAVLGLVVLVVMVMIFSGKFQDFRKGTDKVACPTGTSAALYDQCADPVFGNFNVPQGQVCCRQRTTGSS